MSTRAWCGGDGATSAQVRVGPFAEKRVEMCPHGASRSRAKPGSSTSAHRRSIMPFRVSGKNIDIGAALRARVNQRLVQATAKYFDGGFSGHVTIGKEGFGFRTECVVHLDSGIVLEANALAADAYASAYQAALRLEQRLRRYQHPLKDHQ